MTVGRIPSVEGGIQPTLLTAKGDLISATAASTVARLAVGTNNQILVADSSTATGLKWETPSGGSTAKGVSVYNSTSPSTANNTWTLITFDSESYDTDAFHSTSTNTSRLTVPTGLGGKYLVQAQLSWDVSATGYRALRLYKNGTAYKEATPQVPSATVYVGASFTFNLDLVAGDYLELYAFQNSGSSKPVYLSVIDGGFSLMYWGA
jgi:hypothetical protein